MSKLSNTFASIATQTPDDGLPQTQEMSLVGLMERAAIRQIPLSTCPSFRPPRSTVRVAPRPSGDDLQAIIDSALLICEGDF